MATDERTSLDNYYALYTTLPIPVPILTREMYGTDGECRVFMRSLVAVKMPKIVLHSSSHAGTDVTSTVTDAATTATQTQDGRCHDELQLPSLPAEK